MRIKGIIATIRTTLLILLSVGCGVNNNDDENNNGDPDTEPDTEIVDDEPVYGGELVVPITYIESLNPLVEGDKNFYFFSKLMYEGLFDFDKDLNIENVLAKSYEITDGGKTIKIQLKDNVSWHDGEEFTADDVKFTVDVIKYGAAHTGYRELLTNAYQPGKPNDIEHIFNVKVIDELNIEIEFDRSYSNALESLTFPILPRHQFTQDGNITKKDYEEVLTREDFQPIGTGPYRFMEYIKLKSVTLELYDNWWKGKPYIEKITGKILKDEELALTSFEAGLIDLTIPLGIDWEKYTQSDKVRIYEYVSQIYEFLGFNFNSEVINGERGNAIRQAIAYGIDRQTIIEKIYLGHATQTDVPIPPNSWLNTNYSYIYGYNIGKARDILEGAGWTDTNNDGFYEDENGEELTIRLLTNSYNEIRRATADLIKDNLENIGIRVLPLYDTRQPEKITQEMIDNQWLQLQERITEGEYDMILTGWELSYIPDLSFAFHSSQIEYGTNFIAYQNEIMDSKLVEVFQATSRPDKRDAYEELQALLVEELPYISLYFRNSSILVDTRIRGEIDPQSFNIFYGIENWYIPEPYQEKEENNTGETSQ